MTAISLQLTSHSFQWLVITEDATIILLSPPLPTRLLLLERGGGSYQTQPDCGRRMALSLLLILFLLLFLLFILLHCCWAI
jgi:hypothetical protein